MFNKVVRDLKRTKPILVALSFTLLLNFVSTTAVADSTGTFMVVKGDVQVTSKAGGTQKAKIGMKVQESDIIASGPDSRAKIVMSDKNVINISPDTKLELEKYIYDPNSDNKQVSLNVLQGKVRATVEQKYDGEKNKFHVKTPSAVAGVRGTDFLTSFSPKNRETKIVTFEGRVAVGLPGPNGSIANPVYVNPGQTTTAQSGAPPSKPEAVPANELKNMNSETQADSGKGNEKKDTAANSDSNEDKKDEQKEDKKEEKQATNEESKDENTEESKDDKQASKEESKEDKKTANEEPAKEDKKAAKEESKDDKPAAKEEPREEKKATQEERKEDKKAAISEDKKEPKSANNSEGKNNGDAGPTAKSNNKESGGPGSTTASNGDPNKAGPNNNNSREPAGVAAPSPGTPGGGMTAAAPPPGGMGSMINTADLMPTMGNTVINPNIAPVLPTTNFDTTTKPPITQITDRIPQETINNAITNTSSRVNIVINKK